MTPGHLPDSALTPVNGGAQLANAAAASFKRINTARGWRIAAPAGGYRSAATQDAMHNAGAGHDRAAKLKWGLDPNSSVAIARHPYGTHEDGTRGDWVGFPITPLTLAYMAANGWTREFGGRDPRHFKYNAAKDRFKPKPAAASAYVVQQGDTLAGIASHYGTTWQRLAKVNKLSKPYVIHPGQRLHL